MFSAHASKVQLINTQFVVGAWCDLDIVVTCRILAFGDIIPKKNKSYRVIRIVYKSI
jgi:hypothetical protein